MLHVRVGVALIGLLAGLGCGGDAWDPGYPVGLKVRFTISQNIKSMDLKWTEGASAPTAQTSSVLVGNALVSSGSDTSTGAVIIDRTWHIIGKSYEHVDDGNGDGENDDSDHRVIYWVEGQDVVSGTGERERVVVVPDGSGGVTSTTISEQLSMANQTVAYQFILYGAHGDVLGQDGFVYARPLTANAPSDVNGVVSKLNPSSGQVWFQSNGIHRVIDGANTEVGDTSRWAERVEVRRVGAPGAASNILDLCVGRDVGQQSTQGPAGSSVVTSDIAQLNAGCENRFVSDRAGVAFIHGNLPVKFEGQQQDVNVRDFGYEWVECDGAGQPLMRGDDTTRPTTTTCGAPVRYIEYTLTDVSDRNVSVTAWEESPLPEE